MEGVAGIAVAREYGLWLHSAFFRTLFGLHDEVCRAFAEIQTCTCGVERTAPLGVENHQRVKSVEVKLGDALAAAYDHDIGFAAA